MTIVIPDHIYSDPLWEGPLAPLTGYGPKTRWGIIAYVYKEPEPDPCPGEGKCHGCRSWCAWCGTVTDVCDANEWPARCDRHERYPAKPEPPKPDPRQLYLPGFGVDAADGRLRRGLECSSSPGA